MKRCAIILLAMLLLALTAFGCNREPKEVDWQLPDPTESVDTTESSTEPTELSEELTEDELSDPSAEPTDPADSTAATANGDASSSRSTTTKASAASGASSSSSTSKTSTSTAKTTTTTKKTSTTTTTKASTTTVNQSFANPISITSTEQALSVFNAQVAKAVDGKAGFSKSHKITYSGWDFDPAMLDLESWGIPGVLGSYITTFVGDPNSFLSSQLNSALDNGVNTANQVQGNDSVLIKKSTLTASDLNSITYAKSGSDWVITLNVKDGQTRQEKRLLSSGFSGSAPLKKGPLNQATDFGTVIYDHMTADRVFSWVKSQLSILQADPIDISEKTTNTKLVMTVDGGGTIKELKASYNQVMYITEIKLFAGLNSFKDSEGSSSVSITYGNFVF